MKPFTTIAALLLGFIAVMQGVRFALAWPITVNTYSVPVWASGVAAVVVGAIAVMLWREGRR
jgi:hypothetical protein